MYELTYKYFTTEELKKACNKAYKKAGNNAYFCAGFSAGVEFGLKHSLQLCVSALEKDHTSEGDATGDNNIKGNITIKPTDLG